SSATVTPSLVTLGLPQPLSMTALRPRGPRVHRTARASLLTPARSFCRASSLYVSCFAPIRLSPFVATAPGRTGKSSLQSQNAMIGNPHGEVRLATIVPPTTNAASDDGNDSCRGYPDRLNRGRSAKVAAARRWTDKKERRARVGLPWLAN